GGAADTGAALKDEALVKDKRRRGTGSGSKVILVLGAKDSDTALSTRAGNALFAPRFIAMGHELTHALHNSKGVNRHLVAMPEVPEAERGKWSNREEYHTIIKGRTSEQALRDQ